MNEGDLQKARERWAGFVPVWYDELDGAALCRLCAEEARQGGATLVLGHTLPGRTPCDDCHEVIR